MKLCVVCKRPFWSSVKDARDCLACNRGLKL